MRLNLLTFNTLGTPFFAPDIAGRYQKIAELISANDIDIVCFQEVFSHYNRHFFDKGLSKKFPYKVYKQFVLGLYGGLAIYSKVPLDFVTYHVYTYPKGLSIPIYTSLARSGLLVCKLKNIPLTLATTHLSSDVVHNLTAKNRFYRLISTQLDQTADLFNSMATGTESILLTGDFNISNDSELYKQFLKKTKALDLFKNQTAPSYSPDRIPYIYPATTAERIDFMFYKGKLKLKAETAQLMFEKKEKLRSGKATYLSDHIGLFTSLRLI